MADDHIYEDPQTHEQVRWDGRDWVPIERPGFFGAMGQGVLANLKPLVGAGGVQLEDPKAFASSFQSMTPEQRTAQVGETRAKLAAMPSSDQMSEAGRSYRERKAGGQSATRAIAEGTYSLFGANMQDFDEALKQGRIGEALGHLSVPIAMLAGGKLLEQVPIGEAPRRIFAGALDVGKNFEDRARREHAEAMATINRDYEAKIQADGKKTTEGEAEYRTKLEQARDDYSAKIAEAEKKRTDFAEHLSRLAKLKEQEKPGMKKTGVPARTKGTSLAAEQSEAAIKQKGFTTQPHAGPVYQRLSGMADQLGTQDVPKLDKAVRAAQDNRWNAWRLASGDKPDAPLQVQWTPVQDAISSAEANILHGSPDNIAIFRNMLREGVDPNLETATVFKGRATAIQDVLGSEKLTPEGRARLLETLGREGQFEPRAGSGPAPSENVSIPLDDARGYYTELGEKIGRTSGDVRAALKSVQKAVDEKAIKPAIPKNQIPIYERLKADWGQYIGDFKDFDGPLAKLTNAGTADARLNLLSGADSENIVNALGRYARFFPTDRNLTGMVGSLRSMMKEIRGFSGNAGEMPGRLPPPSLPREPKTLALSERPKQLEPLDVTKEKIQKLENKATEWSQLRPWQMRHPSIGVLQRVIGEILSHPDLQKWIARAK